MREQQKIARPDIRGDLKKYQRVVKQMNAPAKTILLREGEIPKKIFIVKEGCLRIWFDHDGKEITFQFFFENEPIASIDSFMAGKPSPFTIETIEPCILHVIQKKDFDNILKKTPALKDFLLEMAIQRMGNYAEHFLSIIKDKPPQRYLKLLKERPHILRRVPQHYIASYLGITPVSLSRIRNKIRPPFLNNC
jgi:CRP-like cAMP-binding protein